MDNVHLKRRALKATMLVHRAHKTRGSLGPSQLPLAAPLLRTRRHHLHCPPQLTVPFSVFALNSTFVPLAKLRLQVSVAKS